MRRSRSHLSPTLETVGTKPRLRIGHVVPGYLPARGGVETLIDGVIPVLRESHGIESIVIAGVETHVCVLQTAIDLMGRGFTVFVVVDAVGSRFAIDHDTAIARLAASGAVLTTCETVLFEWCRSADHPRFRAVRDLVLRPGPERGPEWNPRRAR